MTTRTEWRLAELPDGSLARTSHTRMTSLKPARHVLLALHCDGPMIYRYAEDLQFAGDTWHEDEAAALEQIKFEFGVSNLQWRTVSQDEATEMMRQRKEK